MNVSQMFVAHIAAVVLSTTLPFASVCQNMKVVRQMCHANLQKMLAQYQLADRIRNVRALVTELQNAHVCPVLLKVQTQFAVALNRRVLVNHSRADPAHHVMSHEIQFASVQNQHTAIHSNNVVHHLLLTNFANQIHAEVSDS